MKLAVLAPAGDACAAAVSREARRLCGAEVPLLDLAVAPSSRVVFGSELVNWDGVALTALDCLFVCGFDYEEPNVPRAEPTADYSVWQIDYIVDQQRRSFVASVLRDLERRGVRVVNSWAALQAGFSRPGVFGMLARAGCDVPRWLASNDPSAVREFCRDGRILWRPAAGRAKWQPFLDRQREHLVAPAKAPILLAEAPRQKLRRAFLCDGEVLLALECAEPTLRGLERMEEVVPCDPAPYAKALAHAVRAVGATWAAVTYAETAEAACIYDVDIDPRYSWLPEEHRAYLAARIAARLLGGAVSEPAGLPLPPRGERDSLFQQRMLHILHQMEATKYAPE